MVPTGPDLESLETYLLAKPGVTEEVPFGPQALVYKVMGKMFALLAWDETPVRVSLKCDPDRAEQLRKVFPGVRGAPYLSKRHWNAVDLDGSIPDEEILGMIDDSYDLVVAGLPRRLRAGHDDAGGVITRFSTRRPARPLRGSPFPRSPLRRPVPLCTMGARRVGARTTTATGAPRPRRWGGGDVRTYYDVLAAERLRRCYELAPPEVQDYLDAEIAFISEALAPGMRILELGCGYGRVLTALAGRGVRRVGMDLSLSSLALARRERRDREDVALVRMDVTDLAFLPAAFDLVYCPQNGISAFHCDPRSLIASSLDLVAPGGKALFFSYADAFWPHRLAWFRIQAAHGLIGEIDEGATGDAVIVCRDGFTATTVSPDRFAELTRGLGASVQVSVLHDASVVCSITV